MFEYFPKKSKFYFQKMENISKKNNSVIFYLTSFLAWTFLSYNYLAQCVIQCLEIRNKLHIFSQFQARFAFPSRSYDNSSFYFGSPDDCGNIGSGTTWNL